MKTPAFQSRARRAIEGGLGDGQLDRGDAGRAGLAARTGSGAPPVQNRRSACWRRFAGGGVACCAAGGARQGGAVERGRTAAVRSWARAVRAVCRQIASQVLAWDWSQPRASFPVLNVVSIGHR